MNFLTTMLCLMVFLSFSCGKNHSSSANSPKKRGAPVAVVTPSVLVKSSELLTRGWRINQPLQAGAHTLPPQKGAVVLGKNVILKGGDLPWSAFTLVIHIDKNDKVKVLTQMRASHMTAPRAIETSGGHLTQGKTFAQGGVEELKQEAGIIAKPSDLIVLQQFPNVRLGRTGNLYWNTNFLLVFKGGKPQTNDSCSEIDPNYGHKWVEINDLYLEMKKEDKKLGSFNHGKFYSFFRSHLIHFVENVYPKLGTITFAKIPDQSLWGANTYYVWGANKNNYNLAQGTPLNGGGMASVNGPTQGVANDQFIGLITTTHGTISAQQAISTNQKNVYPKLDKWLRGAGHSIVIPVDSNGKFALGTGLASGQNTPKEWHELQKDIFQSLDKWVQLGAKLDLTQLPAGTVAYWPDCNTMLNKNKACEKSNVKTSIDIRNKSDLQLIINAIP